MANKKSSIEKSLRESQQILFRGTSNVVKNSAIRWNHIEDDDVKENNSSMMGSELVDVRKRLEWGLARVYRQQNCVWRFHVCRRNICYFLRPALKIRTGFLPARRGRIVLEKMG